MTRDIEATNGVHAVPGIKVKSMKSDAQEQLHEIIDIRTDTEGFNLVKDIKSGLRPADGGEKSLPTLLLYDEAGLKLYEDITYLEDYYLVAAEIEVLTKYSDEIAKRIEPESIIVELGSGNLRKIKILLDALERAGKDCEYYALDVSKAELKRTLAQVPRDAYKHLKCFGLHGTYDDGLLWLQTKDVIDRPKNILTMGSSIGNFRRKDAYEFLRSFADTLQPGDNILIGIDACKDPEKVYKAYNDSQGITHKFVLHGLTKANELMKCEAFNVDQWKVIGEFDAVAGRHHAFVCPTEDVVVDGVMICKDERVRIEESYKWSVDETARMLSTIGLSEGSKWSNTTADYALHMAYKPAFHFSPEPAVYAATPVPAIAEWRQLWSCWDVITQQMIPKEDLLEKPIKLRNACIFYLGHIPTFLDIHLTRATKGAPTEPAYYPQIFERGVDPDVDNPEMCHAHSEIPDEYPPLQEILQFQERVRERVEKLITSGTAASNFAIKKALWLGFEHEVMHLETLLYMLVQSEKTLAPTGAIIPDFSALADEAKVKAVNNEWLEIPARTVELGMTDNDNDITTERFFGWDNEKPRRKADVKAFSASARPITVGDYIKYMKKNGIEKTPSSWIEMNSAANGQSNGSINGHTNGDSHANGSNGTSKCIMDGRAVRTVFGAIPLKFALEWPVMASYDELNGFAKWTGGHIPTMEEVRSIYEYVEDLKKPEFENAIGKRIPAVNGHLVNEGVEETPPSHPSLQSAAATNGNSSTHILTPSPETLFIDLRTSNVGFKHWHPTPITSPLMVIDPTTGQPTHRRPAGQGETGGAWEWTSTELHAHQGFQAMELYPGYTADFFDEKHNICLGGSWATHPRVAGRKSFVNWYQRNYPFVWATARVVKDL